MDVRFFGAIVESIDRERVYFYEKILEDSSGFDSGGHGYGDHVGVPGGYEG